MSGIVARAHRIGRATLSLFRIRLAEALQYRAAAVGNAAIGVFWALIMIMVYRVFFTLSDNAAVPGVSAGMTLAQAVGYVWLGQMLMVLPHQNVDGETVERINNGDIGLELCRPFPMYWHWFARIAASKVSALLLRGLLVLIVGLLMPRGWRMEPPASAAHLLCFVVSLFNALVLSVACGNLIYTVRLNVAWGQGPAFLLTAVAAFLSGGFMPLALMPEALQNFLLYQPFAGLLDIPSRLYLGMLAPGDAWFFWVVQWGWTLGLLIIGWLLMRRRLGNIVMQGG